jgi:hypothetical protein
LLELIKGYICQILCHPGRANVVADALSRKYCDDETDPAVVIGELAQ